jgi:alpha-tubulin suppressor-like RCC1 family protein
VGSLTIWSETMGQWSVRTDGRLYAWGSNGRGQLGLGDTTSKSSPIQVGSLTNWLRPVSRHDTTNGALKTDGSLWTAGDQSVKGTLNNFIVPSPVQVSGSQGWAKVNMRGAAIGVKTNGTLWTWGDNGDGALGNGSASYATSASCPVQVGALTNWNNTSLGNDAVNGNFSYTNQAIKTTGLFGYGEKGALACLIIVAEQTVIPQCKWER